MNQYFLLSEIDTINFHEENNTLSFKEELHEDYLENFMYVESNAANGNANIDIDAGNVSEEDSDDMPDLLPCAQNKSIAIKSSCEIKECKIEKCITEECNIEKCKIEEGNLNECKIEEIEEIAEYKENVENISIGESKPICDTRDSEMGKQLEIVRKQLEELSQLPSTIQATIEEVKRQIAGIIQFKTMEIQNNVLASSASVQQTENSNGVEQESKKETENDSTNGNERKNSNESNEADSKNENESVTREDGQENGQEPKKEIENGTTTIEHIEEISVQKETFESESVASFRSESVDTIAARADEQIAKLKLEKCFGEQQDKWFNEKKQVRKHHFSSSFFYFDVANCFLFFFDQKKLQQQIFEKVTEGNPMPSKIREGPRTPSERPLVLPGGRKWRNARDAYNEEFIAETMSAHAELINGSTIG